MNNWMRRRIERSRARCERAAANSKTDKDQKPDKQHKLGALAPPENGEKGN